MHPLISKTIELARSRVGIREIGHSNTGVEVNAWLRAAGVGPSNPWCAAFAYATIDDAAREIGVTNPMIRSAYVPDIASWARNHKIFHVTPSLGSDFLQLEGGSEYHHTGIVTDLDFDNCRFLAVAGNTNSDGAREGYEVLEQWHQISSRFAFAAWGELLTENLTRALILSDHKVCDMPVLAGVSYAPIRKWCLWMGMDLNYNPGSEPVFGINGRPIPAQTSIIGDSAYAPLWALVAFDPTLKVTPDLAAQTVTVSRVQS